MALQRALAPGRQNPAPGVTGRRQELPQEPGLVPRRAGPGAGRWQPPTTHIPEAFWNGFFLPSEVTGRFSGWEKVLSGFLPFAMAS